MESLADMIRCKPGPFSLGGQVTIGWTERSNRRSPRNDAAWECVGRSNATNLAYGIRGGPCDNVLPKAPGRPTPAQEPYGVVEETAGVSLADDQVVPKAATSIESIRPRPRLDAVASVHGDDKMWFLREHTCEFSLLSHKEVRHNETEA